MNSNIRMLVAVVVILPKVANDEKLLAGDPQFG